MFNYYLQIIIFLVNSDRKLKGNYTKTIEKFTQRLLEVIKGGLIVYTNYNLLIYKTLD